MVTFTAEYSQGLAWVFRLRFPILSAFCPTSPRNDLPHREATGRRQANRGSETGRRRRWRPGEAGPGDRRASVVLEPLELCRL